MNRPQPPVVKMPGLRMALMIAVAFVLEMAQTICALLLVFAPKLICYFGSWWIQNWSGQQWAGDIGCWVSEQAFTAANVVGIGVGISILGWALGFLVTIFSFSLFFLWFRLAGISLSDRMAGKLFVKVGAFIAESVPFFNVLPWFTVSVILITNWVRKEDKKARKKYEEDMRTYEEAENARTQQESQVTQIRERRRAQAAQSELSETAGA